jgi:hypothetical protein
LGEYLKTHPVTLLSTLSETLASQGKTFFYRLSKKREISLFVAL